LETTITVFLLDYNWLQVRPPFHPPADPHRGEAVQVPLLPLQRLQAGHDHQTHADPLQVRASGRLAHRGGGGGGGDPCQGGGRVTKIT